MGLFAKKNKYEDIDKALKKVRGKYEACISDFNTADTLFKEFEDRYLQSLRKNIDTLHFLYQEYLTADAIYKAAKNRQEQKEHDEKRAINAKERDVIGNVYAEFEARIKKYKPSGFVEEDNELNRLYGAFQTIYNTLWMEAEPMLRKKFKMGFQNPIDKISSDLYQFVLRPGEKIPHSLMRYKTTIRRNEKEQIIEKQKNLILKNAAFLFHSIVDILREAQEDSFYYESAELFRFEYIEEKVYSMIHDFRLISFKEKRHNA